MNRTWLWVVLGCICILSFAGLTEDGASRAAVSGQVIVEPLSTAAVCEQAYTGHIRSVYRICSTNPDVLISGQGEIHLANYDQWVNTTSAAPCITMTIASRVALSSTARYPVDNALLPADIRYYLLPEPAFIQSDNPDIIALAQELTVGITQQDRAVAAITSWVGTHISRTSVITNDALSVLRNRTGTSRGFAALAAALLRAAGIPAQYVTGGVVNAPVLGWAWPVPDQGDYQHWVLVYYPDIGWVPSDPQRTINWIDTSHIAAPFSQFKFEYVEILRVSYTESVTLTEQYAQPFTDTLVTAEPLYSAVNTAGHVLEVSPSGYYLLLPKSPPQHAVILTVASLRCDGLWALASNRAWLTPVAIAGDTRTAVTLVIDTSSLSPGIYTAQVTLSTASGPGQTPISRIIPVTLVLAEQVHTINLPVVNRP